MRGGFAGIKFFYVADGSKRVLCFGIINQEDGDMSVLFDISAVFVKSSRTDYLDSSTCKSGF